MNELERILALADDMALSAISTPEAFRARLSERPEVISLRRALQAEAVTLDQVWEFVRGLLGNFRRGVQLPEDIVIAAVSVAVETYPVRAVQEFMEDLARVRVSEMPLAPRVARLGLAERNKRVTPFTLRVLRIAEPLPQPFDRFDPIPIDAGIDIPETYEFMAR